MSDTDTSPESLRKFLESDDASLVLMGLSMAKGVGVEEELLPLVLVHALFAEEADLVRVADEVFMEYAPKELRDLSKVSALYHLGGQSVGRASKMGIRAFRHGGSNVETRILTNFGELVAHSEFAIALGEAAGTEERRASHSRGFLYRPGLLYRLMMDELEVDSDDYYEFLIDLAKNPNCPVALLELLADASDLHIVCIAVAQNSNCPASVLEVLAQDEYWAVRWIVAQNPNCAIPLLEVLAQDGEEHVRNAALANPNCPDHLKP